MLLIPEDGIIPSRPNSPKHCYNNFHEERSLNLCFEQIKSVKNTPLDYMCQPQQIPTRHGKRTVQEKMMQGLLYVQMTENTVITVQLHVFSSNDILGAQTIFH